MFLKHLIISGRARKPVAASKGRQSFTEHHLPCWHDALSRVVYTEKVGVDLIPGKVITKLTRQYLWPLPSCAGLKG